jgi:hypothetical protein
MGVHNDNSSHNTHTDTCHNKRTKVCTANDDGHSGTVAVISSLSSITSSMFHHQYLTPYQPVCIRGAVTDWRAYDAWRYADGTNMTAGAATATPISTANHPSDTKSTPSVASSTSSSSNNRLHVHVPVLVSESERFNGSVGSTAQMKVNFNQLITAIQLSRHHRRRQSHSLVATTTVTTATTTTVTDDNDNNDDDDALTARWLTGSDKHVYLCQCSILSRNDDDGPPLLSHLAPYIPIPLSLLSSSSDGHSATTSTSSSSSTLFSLLPCVNEITSINLWVSLGGTRSNLHYDEQHNWLCVITGHKRVTLYSPADTPYLYAPSLSSMAAHHSPVDISDPQLDKYPLFTRATPYVIELHRGDALFIPEGWWHQVDSWYNDDDPLVHRATHRNTCSNSSTNSDSKLLTIAVNIWWNGPIVNIPPHQQMYNIRHGIQSMVQQHRLHSMFPHGVPPSPSTPSTVAPNNDATATTAATAAWRTLCERSMTEARSDISDDTLVTLLRAMVHPNQWYHAIFYCVTHAELYNGYRHWMMNMSPLAAALFIYWMEAYETFTPPIEVEHFFTAMYAPFATRINTSGSRDSDTRSTSTDGNGDDRGDGDDGRTMVIQRLLSLNEEFSDQCLLSQMKQLTNRSFP